MVCGSSGSCPLCLTSPETGRPDRPPSGRFFVGFARALLPLRVQGDRPGMERTILTIMLCLLPPAAWGKPSRHPPVTQFSGDRYVSTAQMGADVLNAVK